MTTDAVDTAVDTATRTATIGPVAARPYPWPYDGTVPAARTALICIDWQVDFCGPGGYVDRMGYDIELTRQGLAPTARLLAHARETGMLVVHTREGHAADLSDLPANKRWRSRRIGRRSAAPVRWGGYSSAANPAGRSCRRSPRCPARC